MFLPPTDLVPVFSEGYDRGKTQPAFYLRSYCHELKAKNEGYFVDHGKAFVLLRFIAPEIPVTGLLGKGVIPFARVQNKLKQPERLHYPIPACADHRVSWMHRFLNSECRSIASDGIQTE